MGKKGVMLDNGKSAQSSMTLFWKNNKERAKHPKQKTEPLLNEEQLLDKRVMSNFQKWKLHKEKAITKAYTKTTQKQQEIVKKQDDEDQEYLQRFQKQKKEIHLPGFKSKQDLAKKLHIQQIKKADQSTNILKLPQHMGNMSQQQIIELLRSKKNKQKGSKQAIKQDYSDQKQDVLLGEQFINLIKKNKQQQAMQQQIIPIKKQQAFFKSDLLNKINEQGIKELEFIVTAKQNAKDGKSILNEQNKKLEVSHNTCSQKTLQIRQITEQNRQMAQQNIQINNKQQKKKQKESAQKASFKSKFIPRVLQK